MKSVLFKKIGMGAQPPKRATGGAVGYDVFAYHLQDKKTREHSGDLPFVLLPGKQILIGIGVIMAIPWPTEAEARPRSGMANTFSVELRNSPGTIDPDFRGEAGILLCNKGDEPFTIEKGTRIAQLVFSDVQLPVLVEADVLPKTIRNTGGFGSTGLTDISEGTEAYDRLIHELDVSYMKMAIAASDRSNCARGCPRNAQGKCQLDSRGRLVGQTRKFGCVIVNADNIVGHGFNAQAPGQPLCSEVGCLRDELNIASGTQLEKCRAVHAEQYAFLKMVSSGVGASTRGATMYVTAEPCEICAKMIAGSGIDCLVVLGDVYLNNQIDIVRAACINVRYVHKKDLE